MPRPYGCIQTELLNDERELIIEAMTLLQDLDQGDRRLVRDSVLRKLYIKPLYEPNPPMWDSSGSVSYGGTA